MQAIELVKTSFDMASGYSAALLDDLSDKPLQRVVPNGGANGLWLIGHLVVAEAAVLDQYLLGQPHRFQSWCPAFATGSTPVGSDGSGPCFDELKAAFVQVRSDLKAYIDGLTDKDLEKPCHENGWPGPNHESVGACLMAMIMHMTIHAGQAASIRGGLGRPPLFG